MVNMTLEGLVSSYGYAAIIIGTFLEGETVLILGALAAHQGYLDLYWVIVCGFLGGLAGDQFYFYLGHFQGRKILARRPQWQSKSARILDLLARHQTWLILGFRFVYGIRTMTPILIGTSRVKPLYYLLLDSIGVATWANLIAYLGYLFGKTLEIMIGNAKHYELLAFIIIAVFAVLIWALHHIKRFFK